MTTTAITVPPLRAVHLHCVRCCGSTPRMPDSNPRACNSPTCALYPLRVGKGVQGVSTLGSIRQRCLDCHAGNAAEVRRCADAECELWHFRMGHNPRRTGIGRDLRSSPISPALGEPSLDVDQSDATMVPRGAQRLTVALNRP